MCYVYTQVRLTCLGGRGRGEVDRVAQDAAEQEARHGAGNGAGCLLGMGVYSDRSIQLSIYICDQKGHRRAPGWKGEGAAYPVG
jgi:hypothetical protein